jgi:hypothetical protein
MGDLSSIIDPFHRSLHIVVAEKIDTRMRLLAAGKSLDFADYKQQVGYLEALNDVLDICQELEHERYGAKPVASRKEYVD